MVAISLKLVWAAFRKSVAVAGLLGVTAVCAQTGGEILLGQSGGFTGGQAEYSADIRLGIEAAFTSVNTNGGVSGRKVRLVAVDDGGKRDAVLANTKKLVEEERVLALIGYTSGAGTEGSLDYIAKAKVPILSPATGNMGIRAAFNPYLFHTRAGYIREMMKIADYASTVGLSRVALAYLGDVGPANLRSMQEALAAYRLQAVATVALDRNAQDFSKEVTLIAGAKPQLVVFISNAGPVVKITRGLRAVGYAGLIATSSFAGSRVIKDLKEHSRGLILIQVLPQPRQSYLPLQRELSSVLAKISPEARPNYTMLEGFVAGRVFIEALRRTGSANPSRPQLIAALESLTDLDLGGYRVSFGKSDRDGSNFVDLGVVDQDGQLRF